MIGVSELGLGSGLELGLWYILRPLILSVRVRIQLKVQDAELINPRVRVAFSLSVAF